MIKKAVIAVAGFGTRFLPATKAQPKEMLPLIDKPVIQYIVEELVASGIEMIVFVTSQNKRAIEDHFDKNFELEYLLKHKKKDAELEQVQHISKLAEFVYIRQKSPRGWGDAILCSQGVIGNDPFIYSSGDDVFLYSTPPAQQLLDVYEKYQDGVLGVVEVPRSEVNQYGIVDGIQVQKNVYQIQKFIEKPSPAEAPSRLAVSGRYVFTPEIFSALKKAPLIKGELVGTEGIKLIMKQRPFYARRVDGTYFDCGNKLGFLKATVDFGLQRKEFHNDFQKFLKDRMK